MATRNIENWKERLINTSILYNCSARLPVYAIIIALVIPDDVSYRGLTLMLLYLIGFEWLFFGLHSKYNP
jgi:ferrous iron transport protein B